MKRLAVRLVALAAVMCAAMSCVEPPSREFFVLRGDSDGGRYRFTLDFADSTSAYDIYIYTRIYSTGKELEALGDFPMHVWFRSPSDGHYRETVNLPLRYTDDGRPKSREFFTLYRSGIRQRGKWDMEIQLMCPEELAEGIFGMGIQMVKRDGQR